MKWDYVEPARVRAVVVAVLQLCAALGIVLPFDLAGWAEALIVVLAVVLPIVQGETTRAKVWSQRSKDIAVGQAQAGIVEGPA